MDTNESSPIFYLTTFCTVSLAFIGDYFMRNLYFFMWPTPSEYLRYMLKNNVINDPDC